MDKEAIRGKRRARRLALQALYQWQMTGQNPYEIEAQFRAVNNFEKVDDRYFSLLFKGVIEHFSDLDTFYTDYLDREINALNPIELVIIRLGVYELRYSQDLPWRVVLDEAVNMGREYGSTDGHKYVNGILNQVAHKVRAVEIQSEEP